MDIASPLLVLLHLIGFAALFGGYLVQLRDAEPEINAAMLYGSWVVGASGIALVVLVLLGPGLTGYAELVIKGLLTVMIVVLVAKNRKYARIPRGLGALIGVLTLLAAAVAVLWPV
jgi:hypothetical protein